MASVNTCHVNTVALGQPSEGFVWRKEILDSLILRYKPKETLTNEQIKIDYAPGGQGYSILKDLNPNPKGIDGKPCDMKVYGLLGTPGSGMTVDGGLMFDGADDYGIAENLPILSKQEGYTVIISRDIVNLKDGTIASKRTNIGGSQDGAFEFERTEKTRNYGKFTNIKLKSDFISYQTSDSYNGEPITIGDSKDSNHLIFGTIDKIFQNVFSSYKLYEALLFNRNLKQEEIAWVINNVIERRTK